MQVIHKQCNNCGHNYATWDQDELRVNLLLSDWIDVVCKHCTCLLRGYHRWSITDLGHRICADCFIRRIPLAVMVTAMQRTRQDKGVLNAENVT